MSPLAMKVLYDAEFTLPDDALILDISVPGQSPADSSCTTRIACLCVSRTSRSPSSY